MGLDCYLWIYDQRAEQIRVETQLDRLHHLDPVLEHLHGANFGISQDEAAPFVTVAQMRSALCDAPLSTRDVPRQIFWRMEVWRLLHDHDDIMCTIAGQYWRFNPRLAPISQSPA
jgi:hypothetical protein